MRTVDGSGRERTAVAVLSGVSDQVRRTVSSDTGTGAVS